MGFLSYIDHLSVGDRPLVFWRASIGLATAAPPYKNSGRLFPHLFLQVPRLCENRASTLLPVALGTRSTCAFCLANMIDILTRFSLPDVPERFFYAPGSILAASTDRSSATATDSDAHTRFYFHRDHQRSDGYYPPFFAPQNPGTMPMPPATHQPPTSFHANHPTMHGGPQGHFTFVRSPL